MDVLTDVLNTAGMFIRVGEVVVGKPLWRRLASPTEQIIFYAVLAGHCRLVVKRKVSTLSAGDLVFVNQDVAHELRCDDPQVSTLIRGTINFTSGFQGLEFLGLPSVLILHSNRTTEAVFERFVREATTAEMGWRLASEGLATSLFVTALREHGGACSGETHGWLRGLADNEVGQALRLMHERPAHRWTVEELAQRLSMSRSAFAARFKTVTGRPPLGYLTWWRLHRAAARLRRRDGATIAMIAREAGYDSDVSFGKAFRREFGKPPGDVRREAAAATASPLQFELKKRNPFEVPEQETGLNLFKTTAQFGGEYEELFARHGLNSPAYNVLRILRGVGEPVSKDEILTRMVAPNADTPQVFQRLLKSRLIQFDRTQHCSITERGRDVLSQIDEPLLDIHRRQLAHLSPGELAELNRLLVKARRPEN